MERVTGLSGRHGAYRGPNRRDLSAPRGICAPDLRRLHTTAALTFAFGGPLSAAAIKVGAGDLEVLIDGFRVTASVVMGLAGLLFLLRWRLAGDAPAGYLGVGFLLLAGLGAPLAELGPVLHGSGIPSGMSPLTRAFVVGAATVPLLAAVRSPQVDSGLRPVRLLFRLGTVALVGALGATAVVDVSGPQVSSAPAKNAIAVVLTLGWLSLAGRYVGRPGSLPTVESRGVAAAFTLFASAGIARLADGDQQGWWGLSGGLLSLTGALLVAVVAGSGTRATLSAHQERTRVLSTRLRSSERRVEADRSRLHDVRSTVAGIRCASGALDRYRDHLDAPRRVELKSAITAEIARLERLVSDSDGASPCLDFAVDDVLRPLVVAHREQGLTLSWEPSGARAAGSPDDLAEIVTNLLDNALRHGRGAPARLGTRVSGGSVVITVQDQGPGIPAAEQARVFERGERGPGAADLPGEGLGLDTARALAHLLAGDLVLVPAAAGCSFELRVPGCSPLVPGQHQPLRGRAP